MLNNKSSLTDNTKILFDSELKILERAKERLSDEDVRKNELFTDYKEVVESYEKLLKVTTKIFKISDIQGRILKNHETEMNKANDSLRQLEESRRQLVSDISHELGTPMTSIQGYVKAMLDGIIEPEDQYLKLIYDKVLLVNQLVEDLFELSKLESNQLSFNYRHVSIKELINDIIGKFQFDIQNLGLNYIIDPVDNLPLDNQITINIDPVRIEQVMTNLINNAVKYTPAGGTIRIHSNIQTSGKTTEEPGELIIKVIDNGSGIDEKSLPFVFERFFKGNKSHQTTGTGLGLAIAKQIIIKHGGYIGAESKLNKGSTFYFSLPAYIHNA